MQSSLCHFLYEGNSVLADFEYIKKNLDGLLSEINTLSAKHGNKVTLVAVTKSGSDEELIAESCKRLPERLHGVAEKIYRSWIYNLPETKGMRELIEELKASYGVKLYLLSNISKSFSEKSSEIPILKYFDKCIMSADYGVVKPSREIFDILCRECNIKKEESIFIDDSPKNVDGARCYGIKAYLFDGSTEALRSYLLEILSE